MKENRKILCKKFGVLAIICLIGALWFSLVPLKAFAEEAEDNKIDISCTDFQVIQGDTFTTTIYLAEDANLIDFDIHLKYDTDKLTLISAVENEDIKGNIVFNVETNGEIDINYTRTSNNVSKQLPLLDLTFAVSDYIAPGSYKCLMVDFDQPYIAHTLNGLVLQPVDFVCDFALLNIYEMGDVDLSGKVDIGDATYIRRHLAKLTEFTDFQLSLADTYFDGVIDIADAVNLQRFLAKQNVTYGNRVIIDFYNKDGELAFSRSVVHGEDLQIIPELPIENGYINGVWSLDSKNYQEVDFSNITAGFSVYAMYEQEHTEQMEYYKGYIDSFISEFNGKVQGNVVLPTNLTYPTDLSYNASIVWNVSNANLFSREGNFSQPTYGTDFTLTANIYSYHKGESIEAPITEEYKLYAVGVYGTPSKSEIASFLTKITGGELSVDGKSSVEGGEIVNDLKLIRKISNEQVNAETPYEVHVDWEIEEGGSWKAIAQIQRKIVEQIVNLRATISFNGQPLEDNGIVYFYTVHLTAVTEDEIKSYIINQIAANTIMPIKNGTHLWDNDSKYGCVISWTTNNTAVIKNIDAKNNVTVNGDAVNGQTCSITVTVSIAEIRFSLDYIVSVETNNTQLVAGTNIDDSLYYALREELDVKVLTTEALKNTKFVNLDLSKYGEPFEGGDGEIHPAITDLRGLSYCENLFLLNISGLHIEKGLSEISSLTKLECFIASDCGFTSLNDGGVPVLSNATHLKVIDLSFNNLQSLESVLNGEKTYSSLKEVYLNDNQLIDITLLETAPLLEKLTLSNNVLESSALITVGALSNLEYLSLANNKIEDISLLSPLTSLQELRLQNNNISNVDSLKGLTSLERLYLGDNNISNIKNLKDLKKIEVLYLNNNKIRNIDALGNMNFLRVLNITENEITACDSLENLIPNDNYSGLVELYAEGNQISSFSFVENLTGLKKLLLGNNAADNESKYLTKYLSGLTKLEELTLSGTAINSLEFLINEDETVKPLIRLEIANCNLPSVWIAQYSIVSKQKEDGIVYSEKIVSDYVDNYKLLSSLNKTLQYLDVSNNNFDADYSEYVFADEGPSSYEELGYLNKLRVFYTDNNAIGNYIESLVKRMRKLEYVSFENCDIKTTDWLSLSDYYHFIDLANNPIEEFNYQYLENSIETLEYLYLDSTADNATLIASELDCFDGNILKALSMNNIYIGEVKSLPDMESLCYLNLVNTGIADFVGPAEEAGNIYSISRFGELIHLDIAEENVNIFTKNNLEEIYKFFADKYVNLYTEEQLPNGYEIDGVLNAQKESARLLNMIDNMPLDLYVAAEGISDNNPILIRDIFGYSVSWVCNDNHFNANGEKLAINTLDRIVDSTITLSAKVNELYNSTDCASKDFGIDTHIIRQNIKNVSINMQGFDVSNNEVARNKTFIYIVSVIPAANENFGNKISPVNAVVNYEYSAIDSNGQSIDIASLVDMSKKEMHSFTVKSDAKIDAKIIIKYTISYAEDEDSSETIKGEQIISVVSTQYTLTFVTNGATVKDSKDNIITALSQKEETALVYGQEYSITKLGYDYNGLYEDSGFNTPFTRTTMPSKDMTVYVKTTPHTYSISYVTNGGEITKNNDNTFTILSQPTLSEIEYSSYVEYNHFVGWYFDEKCTQPFSWNALLTEPKDIILYAKWDLCAVYNSIDSTPWSLGGRVILDWRNETDYNLLNHTSRTVSSNRFNNIDIANNATEIILIGNSNQVFSNLMMHICNFEKNQKLTIRLINFNFKTNGSTAINIYNDNGVALTIEVLGDCSIGTYCAGGSIINVPNSSLSIEGSGTLVLTAGDGADATTSGGNGGDGGVAIYADNLTIDMTGSLTVKGGKGGNGAKGKDQSLETKDSNAPATATTNGGNGGNGGSALQCSKLNVLDTSKVSFVGGNGGNGGNGGSAGDGYGGFQNEIGTLKAGSYSGYADLPDGANGGDGGNGGAPINQGASISISKFSELRLQYGDGGNGGDGGQGGDAGWPEHGVKPDGKGHGGNAGKGGYGYNGGNSGVGGNGGSSFTNYSSGLFGAKDDHIGTTGDGGFGNSGGNAMSTVIYKNGIKTVIDGTVGKGGRGGYCGSQSGASNGKTVTYGTNRAGSIGANGKQVACDYNVTWVS